ncbi:MAG: hypothetical protein NWE92_13055 [Candidatus Bathyarchaeota archaeon]|nr:hypothetical protein [Candidatus Bathyarchaeota archaeon]
MRFAINAALIITLFCSFVLVSTVKSSGSEETSRLCYVTASASEGGSIMPSGTSPYPYLSDALVKITPSEGNSINEISIDGGKPFPATHFSSYERPLSSNSKNIQLVTVNGQRYILENLWIYTAIDIYEADSNWVPTAKISSSPIAVGDFYVPTLSQTVNASSLFPNCIITIGNDGRGKEEGAGFVALYNLTSNSWTVERSLSIFYVVNIFNPSGNDLILEIADVDHGFVKTTTENLFNSQSWELVRLPESERCYLHNDHIDTRIICFKGYLFTLDINAHYLNGNNSFSWCVYKYNLACSSWVSPDPILYNIDNTIPLADSLYGMAMADEKTLFLVAPFSNGTWSIFYSTDGSTFKTISSVASVNNFNGYSNDPDAECAAASTFDDNGDYILFETQTDHDNKGYIAILDLNGTIIYKQTGFTAHFTQSAQWLEETTPEGKAFMMGSSCAVSQFPAVIRKLTIEYASKQPFTFTFDNIAANHTINATFNTPTTPTPTPSPTGNQFLIESNSTISALSFNATTPEISFTVNGTSGTTGYVKATISKTFMSNGENIKINVDGNPCNCSLDSNDDYWIIIFTYQHSTHQVKIFQTQNSGSATDFSAYLPYVLAAIIIALLGFLGLIIWSTKPKASPTPKYTARFFEHKERMIWRL